MGRIFWSPGGLLKRTCPFHPFSSMFNLFILFIFFHSLNALARSFWGADWLELCHTHLVLSCLSTNNSVVRCTGRLSMHFTFHLWGWTNNIKLETCLFGFNFCWINNNNNNNIIIIVIVIVIIILLLLLLIIIIITTISFLEKKLTHKKKKHFACVNNINSIWNDLRLYSCNILEMHTAEFGTCTGCRPCSRTGKWAKDSGRRDLTGWRLKISRIHRTTYPVRLVMEIRKKCWIAMSASHD